MREAVPGWNTGDGFGNAFLWSFRWKLKAIFVLNVFPTCGLTCEIWEVPLYEYFPLNSSLSGSICLCQNRGQTASAQNHLQRCSSLTAMSNFTIIPLAVVAAVLRDCQHLLPALCRRVSNTTAGAVDRNACLDCLATSNSHFCAPTVSCSHWALGTCLFLLPLLQVQSLLTAAAKQGEALLWHFDVVCRGRNSHALLSRSC